MKMLKGACFVHNLATTASTRPTTASTEATTASTEATTASTEATTASTRPTTSSTEVTSVSTETITGIPDFETSPTGSDTLPENSTSEPNNSTDSPTSGIHAHSCFVCLELPHMMLTLLRSFLRPSSFFDHRVYTHAMRWMARVAVNGSDTGDPTPAAAFTGTYTCTVGVSIYG